jgi:predicted nucleotidyltransferase
MSPEKSTPMNDGLKGLRGHHPVLTHPDVIPVPSHVWCHELGEKVSLMSNSPSQWVAKTGMLLRVTVGSGVHGMAIAGTDDDDHMAVFVEPPEYVIGSKRIENYNFRTQPEGVCSGPDDLDLVAYSLRKFIRLAAQGNPTVLIPLFVPEDDVLYINDFGRELRENRHLFISKQAGARFRGYLESQRRGLMGLRSGGTRNQGRRDYREKYSFDVKFAAHMIRLGVQGIELLSTGKITLPIPEPDLTYLRDLKTGGFLDGAEPGSALWKCRGDAKKAETLARAELLERQLDRLIETSPLPERPDWQAVNAWSISVHRRYWGWV